MSERVAALTAFLMFSISTAAAQPVNLGGIEGHVYDKRTLRPVSGATVQVVFGSLSIDGQASSGLQYFDNPSGFYNILFSTFQVGLPAADSAVTAYCKLKNGKVVSSAVPFYTTPRNDSVYRRDIYLELPRNVTRCLPVDGSVPGKG